MSAYEMTLLVMLAVAAISIGVLILDALVDAVDRRRENDASTIERGEGRR
jgi:hypothetical protein